MKNRCGRWSIRLFNPDADFYPLLALRRAIEAIDQVGDNVTEEGQRESLKWRGHDPTQDRWLVEAPEEPGKLIAYAWVFAQSNERLVTFVSVHPAWRRRGIGSALFAHTLERARHYGATHVTGGRWETALPAHHFLTHHGFEPVGHNRFLTAPPDVALPAPGWPAGYSVRTFAEVQDLSILAAVCNRCYHDMWGHAENDPNAVDEARLAEGMRNSPAHYDPASIFIAFAPDGAVAGVCFGKVLGHEDNDPTLGRPKKIVDSPGVVPAHRHLGLQRPLTLTTMHWLRNNVGPGAIKLWTYGDTEEAIAIYHDLGFTFSPNGHFIEYRWGLPALC